MARPDAHLTLSPAADPPAGRIGLTGGIAAGKSAVAQLWREVGTPVIDLDAHSRRILDEPGDGLEEVVARFGECYRLPTGTIDRTRLGRLVFADPSARADLERIVLSRVDRAVAAEEQQLRAAGHRVIVHDSPLLLEKHHEAQYAVVVAVLARREERLRRILTDRGRDRAYGESVMAAQVEDLERIRRADLLVLNTSTCAVLAARSARVLARARALAGEHLEAGERREAGERPAAGPA